MEKKEDTYARVMREAAEYICADKRKISSPDDVADFVRPPSTMLKQEAFYVLLLDAKNQLTGFQEVTRGTLDSAKVHAREVFREAVSSSACRVVLAHNHPSGDPTPSAQDITSTRALVKAGDILGIGVLDHVIVGKRTYKRSKDWISFREEGLIETIANDDDEQLNKTIQRYIDKRRRNREESEDDNEKE